MKKILFVMLLFLPFLTFAQEPFKGFFNNKELNLRMILDLYEPTVPQPQFEEEMCYGVMSGSLNGHWIILKVTELTDTKAVVRAVSDSGVEAQTLEMKIADNTLEIRQTGSVNIRGVKNSKYTKLPKPIILTRKK